jgi:hypothetical protein
MQVPSRTVRQKVTEDEPTKTLRPRKKPYNTRVRSVYFKSLADLRRVERAARRAKVPLATFIRDAALSLSRAAA